MNEDKESLFKELSNAVSSGDIEAIHTWFKSREFKSREFKSGSDLSLNLSKHIVNEPYFFSFSSRSFDRQKLHEETLKRQLPVLSYFTLKEQLSLLSSTAMDRDVSMEHIKVLNYSKNLKADRSTVLKDIGMCHLFTGLFHKEDFAFMDQIEQYLGLDIKSNRLNKIAIHYDEPNSGAFHLYQKKYNACPLDDIIFNYSENKAKYLKANNIELPDLKYVSSLKEKVLQEIEEAPYFKASKYDKKVQEKVEVYLINYRYTLLNKSINAKPEVSKKANKI